MSLILDGSGTITGATTLASTVASPVFTAPALGTPASGALTSCTSIPASQLTGTVAVANGGTGVTASKQLIQNLNTTTGAVATGTTTIPADDTIPQITEGDQYMSLAITPTSATSTLEIQVNIMISNGSTVDKCTALFRDAVANALAATYTQNRVEGGVNMVLNYVMTSGTTSTITFRVRSGANTGTNTFNGRGGARLFGGTMASSITIKEYTA